MEGCQARTIQELAGHAHLATMQRHMHLIPAAIEKGIRLLDQRAAQHGDSVETVHGGTNKACLDW